MVPLSNVDRSRPAQPTLRSTFLTWGYWLLTLTLSLQLLLVVLPAYWSGIPAAYQPGHSLKDYPVAVPFYTPYTTALLFFPVLSLLIFIDWIAPIITVIWGIGFLSIWRQLPVWRKWSWLGTLLVLWVLTLLTKTASYAFFVWLMD